MRFLIRKLPVQRKHFLYSMVALMLLGPLAITGRLNVGDAIAQNITGGTSAASAPSNIRNTRHNLSSSAVSRQSTSGNSTTNEAIVQAAPGAANNEVCVYCHTPHGATSPGSPLWNRNLSGQNYTPYSSSSLQATDLDVTAAALAAPSKLCLSCHDGTLALGQVANAPGSGNGSAIALNNTGPSGTMPYGRGVGNADHGFTRRLGTDLRNDHPISFTYDASLAAADGELRTPQGTSAGPDGRPLIGNRVAGALKPHFPLTDNKVQCTTCHDPHKQTQKFLNTNRLVRVAPDASQTSYNDWSFKPDDDQICLGCHTRLGKAWAVSAHSLSTVANETYNAGDAAVRDFPTNTPVWQAGCLNCHDTHTAGGSRRLLREGVSGGTVGVSQGYTATIRQGITSGDDYSATSALENTCYQCHSSSPAITPTALSATEGVPNIQAEFARTYRMPITNDDQGTSGIGNTSEVHDITDKDNMESQTQMGFFAPENRHVECSDCHNPHRVVKADTILGGNLAGGDTTRRSHVPARGATGNQGNIASGALRGSWGVEPSYTASGQTTVTSATIWKSLSELPGFVVKKGDPGSAAVLPVGTIGTNATSYLTREYQLCFKCHSNYANGPMETDFPELKPAIGRGGTASSTNSMTRYTNVAAEFAVLATDPPTTGKHQGESTNVGTACGGGDCAPIGAPWDTTPNAGTINHRSWHPVVFPTGRTPAERGSTSFDNLRPPFNNPAKIGLQTMQCSDCHGNAASWTDGTGPNLNQVQGPHGSNDPFLLKGIWDGATWTGSICQNCHNTGSGVSNSGFVGNHRPDSNMGLRDCSSCHIMVPHGWKNKNFLVNLGCVGIEGGETGNCVNNSAWGAGTTIAPYYYQAHLTVTSWARSGAWGGANCSGCDGPMKDCAD